MRCVSFGTDGIRGKAGEELSPRVAYYLGRYLGSTSNQIVIGKDTRNSSDMLESSVVAGATSSGASVTLLGVCTSPCLVRAAHNTNSIGVMITASHNPYIDNGLKVIDKNGEKLGEQECKKIEQYINTNLDYLPMAQNFGRVTSGKKYVNSYKKFLLSCGCDILGLRVALDCANGSASKIAPAVFKTLGAKVCAVSCSPNGQNINNNCGSTHIENLQEAVKTHRCDIGFAFDGDADRVIAVDGDGRVFNGDKLLYILACYLKEKHRLNGNSVVVTAMSNMGLTAALKDKNIKVIETDVGDKNVYSKLKECNYSLGGEQSGHIILPHILTTGDGILNAIIILKIIKENNTNLSSLCNKLTIFPQTLVNLAVKDPKWLVQNNILKNKINEIKNNYKNIKILVRASGTESLVRIMVESKSQEECQVVAEKLVELCGKLSD